MVTVREKAYAKVNLCLKILGARQGYHEIDTLVATVNIFDSLTVTKRKDDKIVVRTGGGFYKLPDNARDNNAYKAAELFRSTFDTKGVDIVINKRIPVAGGLGGSSADIAATLKAMKKLFDVDCDLKLLADSLGSDSGYMLTGGFARLKGRGEEIEFLKYDDLKLHLLIATPKTGVNTAACYAKYDELKSNDDFSVDETIKNLSEAIFKKQDFYNALYVPAKMINPEIERVYGLIDGLSPLATFMSGSGSSVVGIFQTKELCEWAKDKLKRENLILNVTETLTAKELCRTSFFKNPFAAY